MVTISRNAPCPCGSGKKYKQCCLGKSPAAMGGGARTLPLVLALVALAGVGAGVAVGLRSGLSTGVSVGAGTLILIGLFWLLRDPPPPGGNKDPGAINFGN